MRQPHSAYTTMCRLSEGLAMSSGLTPPREHFDSEVRPPVDQFLSDPEVEWKAKCAAVALTSVIEWTFKYCEAEAPHVVGSAGSIDSFRKAVIALCDEIQPVKDIADGVRHRFLTGEINKRVVTTSTDAWSADQGRLKLKSLSHTTYDGRYFDDVVRKVRDFWDGWIATTFR